jgi:hypothetical protein
MNSSKISLTAIIRHPSNFNDHATLHLINFVDMLKFQFFLFINSLLTIQAYTYSFLSSLFRTVFSLFYWYNIIISTILRVYPFSQLVIFTKKPFKNFFIINKIIFLTKNSSKSELHHFNQSLPDFF